MAIPRGQNAFDIAAKLRKQLIEGRQLREDTFTAYCNSSNLPKEHQKALHDANVSIRHVANDKPGAVDMQIQMDLQRFNEQHKTLATVVLISGDIDFIKYINELRFHYRHYTILIHNTQAKKQLLRTANETYLWSTFTNEEPAGVISFNVLAHDLSHITPSTFTGPQGMDCTSLDNIIENSHHCDDKTNDMSSIAKFSSNEQHPTNNHMTVCTSSRPSDQQIGNPRSYALVVA